MYVCLYHLVSSRIQIHTHIHTYMHTHKTHTQTSYDLTHTDTSTHTYTHVYVCVSVFCRMYDCLRICVCLCTCFFPRVPVDVSVKLRLYYSGIFLKRAPTNERRSCPRTDQWSVVGHSLTNIGLTAASNIGRLVIAKRPLLSADHYLLLPSFPPSLPHPPPSHKIRSVDKLGLHISRLTAHAHKTPEEKQED